MRLLVFTTQFPPAVVGVETMTWQLSKHPQNMGEDITVLTPQRSGAAKFDAGETLNIKRYPLSDPHSFITKGKQKLALIKTLRQSVIDAKADAVLCTGWDPCAYIASIACARSPRIPYFLIAHGMELMQLPRGFAARQTKAWMRRRALSGAKKIIAVSSYTRERTVELGVSRQRVSVVPNGVVLAEPRQAAANGNGKVLMTV